MRQDPEMMLAAMRDVPDAVDPKVRAWWQAAARGASSSSEPSTPGDRTTPASQHRDSPRHPRLLLERRQVDLDGAAGFEAASSEGAQI